MPVPSAITDLSTTAASNSPAGSDNVFPDLDNYLRAQASFIALLRDGRGLSTEVSLASAATCDIGGASSMQVQITGTTTITSFGTNYLPRILRFAGALTLTHNAATLILPTGANITTAAGDMCLAVPVGTSGWRVLQYQRASEGADFVSFLQSGSGAATRTVQDKLRESVSVKDYGATGNGSTDDTAAIQAAIDSAGLSIGTTVYFPRGTYIVSSTLNCTQRGVALEGDGPDSTTIKGTHTTGAVVRFYRRFSGLRKIGIGASGARLSATNTTGFGVHFESEDVTETTTQRMQSCFCDSVSIQSQPGTAFYWVGPATQGSMMQNCYANANRGHGFAQDRGILSGRVNTVIATGGCMTIDTCLFYSNLGHGVACAAPSDAFSTPSLRVVIENCEFSANATDAAVRYTDHQIYLKGTNFEVRASVCHGAITGGGIWAAGRNHWIRNNRFLECTHAVTVGYYPELPTQGVNIEGMSVINASTPNMNPAIIVDAGASNIRVLNWLPSFITTLITPNVPGAMVDNVPQVIQKTVDEIINNSSTLQDDDELKFYLDANEKVYFQCVIQHISASTASDIQIAFTTPSGSSLRWGPSNGIKVDATDAVVVQSDIAASGSSVTFGSTTTGRRNIVIEGAVDNGSTAGYLQLQWAQAVATAANTTVYARLSNLKVWRKYS